MIDGLIKLFAYAYRTDRIVVIDGKYCQNEQMLNMLSNWGKHSMDFIGINEKF